MSAAKHGHIDAVGFLIARGANPDLCIFTVNSVSILTTRVQQFGI